MVYNADRLVQAERGRVYGDEFPGPGYPMEFRRVAVELGEVCDDSLEYRKSFLVQRSGPNNLLEVRCCPVCAGRMHVMVVVYSPWIDGRDMFGDPAVVMLYWVCETCEAIGVGHLIN